MPIKEWYYTFLKALKRKELKNNESLEEYISESTITLYDKKKKGQIVILVSDGSEVSSGGSIPNSEKELKAQHSSRVKIKEAKGIKSTKGVPVPIHSGKVDINPDKFKQLKDLDSSDKDIIEKFLNDNIKDLDKLYYTHDIATKKKLWKSIIDKSAQDIKKITVADKEIIEYYNEKKGK